MLSEQRLESLLEEVADGKRIFSAALCIERGDGSFSWAGAAGDMKVHDAYFIASVTKLYMTAIFLQLAQEGKLKFEDPIAVHLPEALWAKIHVLNGVDYSDKLTINHLISNTSGIPDYFFHKQKNGKTIADDLLAGKDEPWPLEKTIGLIKDLKPDFKPGRKGKVRYSDSNYQLLGAVAEHVAGKEIGEVFEARIFSTLGLNHTYTYSDVNDDRPVPFYYGRHKLWLPQYMSSIAPEGGIVSTIHESMVFLKAFFNGLFFPKESIEELKRWNLMFPPPGLFYYGIGLEKWWIPWLYSPFKPLGEVLGFWGQTGTFAFYNPKTDLYFTGATNQIDGAGHKAAMGLIIKMIKSAL